MATGMKRWLAGAAAGLAIVALLTLPPSSFETRRDNLLPEVRAHMALDAEVRRDVGILQAMLWSDSLSALAVRTAVDGLATGVPAGSDVTPEGLASWREALTAFVAETSPRDPDLVFGVFWQALQAGRSTGAPSSLAGRTQTFVGTRDGTPYCIRVYPEPTGITDRQMESATRVLPLVGLGDCRLYVKYGLPGSRVERWLEDGGFRFAGGDGRPPVAPTSPEQLAIGSRAWLLQVGAPVFGLVRPVVADEHPTVGRCLAGDATACERVLTAPEEMRAWNASIEASVEEASPLTHATRYYSSPLFASTERYMLSDLERAFGPDAFARFWTSDADVPEAFQSAFGMTLGSWVRDWAQERVGVHRAGPALRAGAPLWILLTLMLFGAAASLAGTRRRVS